MKNKNKRAIYRQGKRVYIKKSLVIMLALVTATSIIGYQGQRLNNEIKPQDSLGYTANHQTGNEPKKQKQSTTASPVAKNIAIKTNYEVTGVPLNDRQKKVANQIIALAEKQDFKWVPYLVELAWCESKLGEIQTNDKNNKPATSKDRGIFQINDYWHKDISDEQAYNLEWSANWTMNMINNGYQSRWACDKIIRGNNIKIQLEKIN